MDWLTRDELRLLTPPERLALIAELLDSLDEDDLSLSPVQREKLNHNLRFWIENKHASAKWEEFVFALKRRRVESRHYLEHATAAYFDSLTPQARAEEDALARQLHRNARGINFDLEA